MNNVFHFILKDGSQLQGYVIDETGTALKVRTPCGNVETVQLSEIEHRSPRYSFAEYGLEDGVYIFSEGAASKDPVERARQITEYVDRQHKLGRTLTYSEALYELENPDPVRERADRVREYVLEQKSRGRSITASEAIDEMQTKDPVKKRSGRIRDYQARQREMGRHLSFAQAADELGGGDPLQVRANRLQEYAHQQKTKYGRDVSMAQASEELRQSGGDVELADAFDPETVAAEVRQEVAATRNKEMAKAIERRLRYPGREPTLEEMEEVVRAEMDRRRKLGFEVGTFEEVLEMLADQYDLYRPPGKPGTVNLFLGKWDELKRKHGLS